MAPSEQLSSCFAMALMRRTVSLWKNKHRAKRNTEILNSSPVLFLPPNPNPNQSIEVENKERPKIHPEYRE